MPCQSRLLVPLLVLTYGIIPVPSHDKQTPTYLLEHPEVVRLELLPRKLELNEKPEARLAPYTTTSKIYFRLKAINTSLERVTVIILDPYVQNRPVLFRDGEVMPYRKGLDELLAAKEKDPFLILPQGIKLEPNETKLIGLIYIDEGYDPLKPGHYQFSVSHRFEPGQPWIESSSITFEVIRKSERNQSPS